MHLGVIGFHQFNYTKYTKKRAASLPFRYSYNFFFSLFSGLFTVPLFLFICFRFLHGDHKTHDGECGSDENMPCQRHVFQCRHDDRHDGLRVNV